jgi:hypothetical protein
MKKKIAFRNLCHFIPVRIFSDSSGKTVVLKGELTQRLPISGCFHLPTLTIAPILMAHELAAIDP